MITFEFASDPPQMRSDAGAEGLLCPGSCCSLQSAGRVDWAVCCLWRRPQRDAGVLYNVRGGTPAATSKDATTSRRQAARQRARREVDAVIAQGPSALAAVSPNACSDEVRANTKQQCEYVACERDSKLNLCWREPEASFFLP